jgi:hypothetical protein
MKDPTDKPVALLTELLFLVLIWGEKEGLFEVKSEATVGDSELFVLMGDSDVGSYVGSLD